MMRDQLVDSKGNLWESAKSTADHNWQMSSSKSFTNCSGIAQGFVKCPRPAYNASLEERMRGGISLHWFKNFKTEDAPGFDLELDGDQIGMGRETFAYLWAWHKSEDFAKETPNNECLNSRSTAPYETTPITESAWEQVYVTQNNHE